MHKDKIIVQIKPTNFYEVHIRTATNILPQAAGVVLPFTLSCSPRDAWVVSFFVRTKPASEVHTKMLTETARAHSVCNYHERHCQKDANRKETRSQKSVIRKPSMSSTWKGYAGASAQTSVTQGTTAVQGRNQNGDLNLKT